MENTHKLLQKLKIGVLSATIFLFPLFFLSTTQDFFSINKLYLLVFSAMLLIMISALHVFVNKKFVWSFNLMDIPLFVLSLAMMLSTFLVSPNKIQALLEPNFGVILIVALSVIAHYIVQSTDVAKALYKKIFLTSAGLSCIIFIIFFFQPFQSATLPVELSFLKAQYFNTVGTIFDLMLVVGLAIVISFIHIVKKNNDEQVAISENKNFYYAIFAITALSVVLSSYVVIKTFAQDKAVSPFPPYGISWSAAVETLKHPISVPIGIGVNNFAAMFTNQKDLTYNISNQWQIGSFNYSRSALFHILTETGLIGLAGIILLIVVAFKQYKTNHFESQKEQIASLIFVVTALVLMPPSITLFFLLFFAIALSMYSTGKQKNNTFSLDLSTLMPLSVILIIVTVLGVGAASYLLGRAYLAEYHFRTAIIADSKGDLQKVYDNHVQAILLNPYIESYRISFSRVNMFIANSISAKAQANKNADDKTKALNLTDKEKQNVTDRIQIAISEAKAAVTLNSQKSTNWENLAGIYRNILTVAKGADAWTITAYQRAIVLDPNNPIYRLNLGGVYFTLGDYQDAQQLFSDAIQRKSDWPNAYYNLSFAAHQNKNPQLAVAAMEKAITFLDAQKDKADYAQAQKDLVELKKLLPDDTQASGSAMTKQPPTQLSLPTPPIASVEPKLKLQKAAPPATTP